MSANFEFKELSISNSSEQEIIAYTHDLETEVKEYREGFKTVIRLMQDVWPGLLPEEVCV